MTPAILTPF